MGGTMTIRQLLLFVGILIGHCYGNDQTKSFDQERLDECAQSFSKLATTLIMPSALNDAAKAQFEYAVFLWEIKHKELSSNIQTQHDITNQLALLEHFVDCIKRIALKLQLLMVGKNQCKAAYIHESVSLYTYQHILASCIMRCAQWLNLMWPKESNNIQCIDNKALCNIINQAMPAYIKEKITYQTWASYFHKDITDVLSCDLFEIAPKIADSCLQFIVEYENSKYAQTSLNIVEKIATVTNILKELEQINSKREDQSLLILISRLLAIKHDLLFSQQLQVIAEKNEPLLPLYIKYYHLTQSTEFKNLYARATVEHQKTLDAYFSVAEHFFFTQEEITPFFKYMIATTRAGIERIKNEYSSGKPALGVVHISFMKSTDGSVKQNPIVGLMTEALEILDVIQARYNTPKQASDDSNYSSIIDFITSGNWLSGGSIKKITQEKDLSYAVEFSEACLGKKNFQDIKSAALHALVYASPVLLMKIVEYLKPKEAPMLPVVTGGTSNHQQILEFAQKNPALIKQMTDKNPELLDMIASSLQALVDKKENN